MRIIRNIEKARQKARDMWGPQADAWILSGIRYVTRDRKLGNPGPGWNHFDGHGDNWDAAFIDAAFKLKIAELETSAK